MCYESSYKNYLLTLNLYVLFRLSFFFVLLTLPQM